MRSRTAERASAPAAQAGNVAGASFLVNHDVGYGLLEMEWHRVGLDSGPSCAKTIKQIQHAPTNEDPSVRCSTVDRFPRSDQGG